MLVCQNDTLEENEKYLQLTRCMGPTEVKIELSTKEETQEYPLTEFKAPNYV